jgi:hypothetical protein
MWPRSVNPCKKSTLKISLDCPFKATIVWREFSKRNTVQSMCWRGYFWRPLFKVFCNTCEFLKKPIKRTFFRRQIFVKQRGTGRFLSWKSSLAPENYCKSANTIFLFTVLELCSKYVIWKTFWLHGSGGGGERDLSRLFWPIFLVKRTFPSRWFITRTSLMVCRAERHSTIMSVQFSAYIFENFITVQKCLQSITMNAQEDLDIVIK